MEETAINMPKLQAKQDGTDNEKPLPTKTEYHKEKKTKYFEIANHFIKG